MEGMTYSLTQVPLVIQIPQAALGIVPATGNMVLLVCLVKSMREMGCEPYMGE